MTLKQTLSSARRSQLNSFTLVELLVVIGIIAILASVLLAAGNAAIKAAMRTKAQNYANQIQAAATAYYTEYNIYPAPYLATPADTLITDTDTTTWPVLIPILSGNKNPYDGTAYTATGSITNSRAIQFLSLRASDVDVKNCPLNPLPTGGSIYFNMAMDTDYDGMLGTVAPTLGKMPNFSGSMTNVVLTGTATTGVALWANCNGSTTNPNRNYYIHTY